MPGSGVGETSWRATEYHMASNKAESGEPVSPTESKYDQALRALLKEKSKGVPTDDRAEDADKADEQGKI